MEDVEEALKKAGFRVLRVDEKGSWAAILSEKE